MEKIRILIVDDHVVVRQGLHTFLESEKDIQIVGEASNGLEAVHKAKELKPDVILMDLVMPEMDGITAIRKITEQDPEIRILVLTSFSEDEKVFPSIRAGAIGYLLKDSPAENLGRAIRSVAEGEFHLHPDIAKKVLNEFFNPPISNKNIPELTTREAEVLTLLARGLNNKDIASELSISIRTVKSHVSNILNKLHIYDRTQAILYAVKKGLVTPGDDEQ